MGVPIGGIPQDYNHDFSYNTTSGFKTRDIRLNDMGVEFDTRYEAIAPANFLDNFLPKRSDMPDMPEFSPTVRGSLKFATTGVYDLENGSRAPTFLETQMYDTLIKAVKGFCPDLHLRNTSSSSTSPSWTHESFELAPDITVYASDKAPSSKWKAAVFRDAELTFELKCSPSADPFKDSGVDTIPRNTNATKEIRDQMASYSGAILACQFRTHVFSVMITGALCRLARIDHSGVTVSNVFTIYSEPYLVEFLWRYNHATPEYRGHDQTIKELLPTDPDANLISVARRKLKMGANERVYKFTISKERIGSESKEEVVGAALSHKDGSESEELEQTTPSTVCFYGGKISVKASLCPLGRSTRGFQVVDENGAECFLKDTWKVVHKEVDTEGMIYAKLHHAQVPHIPTVVASGLAPGQWQMTSTITPQPNRRHYQHYVIVFAEVGRPLDKYDNEYEFVSAFLAAIIAHAAACTDAGILHRDISAGNILIHGNSGLLIDWDFSKPMTSETPRQKERTGTWQFMSACLLQAPPTEYVRHFIADDLESVFHVLCWITLLYGRHNMEGSRFVTFMKETYDSAIHYKGEVTGGDGKISLFTGQSMRRKAKLAEGPLDDLIKKLEEVLRVRYIEQPTEEQYATYNILKFNPEKFPEIFDTLALIYTYERDQSRLQDHKWIIQIFTEAKEKLKKLLTDNPETIKHVETAERKDLLQMMRTTHDINDSRKHILEGEVRARQESAKRRKTTGV